MSLFFFVDFWGAGTDACLLQGDWLRGPAQQMDQEVLQVQADELLGPELLRLLAGHILQVGVVQTAVEAAARFDHDIRQQVPLRLIHLQDLPPEKFHGGAVALEGDDHQVGGAVAGGLHVVELPGLVEGHLAPVQDDVPVSARHSHIPLVHADKLPEVVGLPGKFEIAHIFKVVDAVQLSHGDGILQVYPDIGHTRASFLFCFLS